MNITYSYGDLLKQNVEVIVNPWNRNMIPWWLLLPQGVSGAIKRHGGTAPFTELAKFGPIPLGEARLTSSGNLKFKAIIHVAGINLLWIATERSITHSVVSAMKLAEEHRFQSIAFPLIGAGSGNRGKDISRTTMLRAFERLTSSIQVSLVEFKK
ncbi:MAG: macro domain-containing protein [Desulfobacterales bacterium]|jgi:O-acetyl-ADP-ribose deacetylase (regulator of RNase III)|nr:macro domain-containing protein [Desulfobacterales bacterium]